MTRTLASLLLGAALLASATQVQAAEAGCSGSVDVLRVSKVKPGQMALFLKASQDQEAWYKSHGLKDSFTVPRVFPAGSKAGTPVGADTAITLHTNTDPKRPANDAGWNAFVKEFADASTIETQYIVCTAAR